MQFTKLALLSMALGITSAQKPGLSDIDGFCPPCVGNKYIEPISKEPGCCPVGTYYRPASCEPAPPKLPDCPGADGDIVNFAGATWKVFCNKTTSIQPQLGASPAQTPEECLDECVNAPSGDCHSPTWITGGTCFKVTTDLRSATHWGDARSDATTYIRQ